MTALLLAVGLIMAASLYAAVAWHDRRHHPLQAFTVRFGSDMDADALLAVLAAVPGLARGHVVQFDVMAAMGSITYYVSMGFVRNEDGELVALDPFEAQTSSVLVSKARALAAKNAGAVAFSRSGDPDVGEFADAKVLWQGGEVPPDLIGG